MALLDWTIFITNVPAEKLSPLQIAKIYGLRWRIEIVFKAWKSHFKMTELPEGSAPTIQAIVYGRLLFIALFHVCFWRADCLRACQSNAAPPSLLKLAQLLATTLLALVLAKLQIPLAASLDLQQQYHCRYEKRRRGHFFSALANLSSRQF
jgi:IS4 transposase